MTRIRHLACAMMTLLCLSLASLSPAHAQSVTGSTTSTTTSGNSTTASNGYNVTWDMLDPGNDWAAQVINAVFPVFGTSTTTTTAGGGIGAESSVIGTMMGWLSGFVMAIAMAVVTYLYFMQIHRGAETSQLMGNNQTSMAIVRLGVAAVLMFPLPTGFNGAQSLSVWGALKGIGMARVIYNSAVQAIGPDGKVIAQPLIPGTKGIVTAIVQDEFCRALINTASNNAGLIPEPTSGTIDYLSSGTSGVVNYAYQMTGGNSDGTPVCGAITFTAANSGATNLAGVTVDQAAMQKTVLDAVIAGDIRGQVTTVAQNFWTTKTTASLAPLMNVIVSATNDYTARLTEQASTLRSQLQASVSARSQDLQSWGLSSSSSTSELDQLNNLGWTGAGAYYLEFARLNGQTLSLMTATPHVTTPSYSGLGDALESDILPLVQSAQTFMQNIDSMVATQDGMSAPGGNADLYSGAIPGGDGATTLGQLFRALHLNDYALQLVTSFIEPSGTAGYWTDPFGNLMSLGNWMITVSLITMGSAAVLSSTAGTVGTGLMSLMSGNVGGVVAAGFGHALMQFFGTPIFMGCMAMLVPGMTIAFVIPMMPFVMWMFGVAGWLIMVCETVIAAPLWMLAHMTTNGEGLHGHARQGYALLFNVIFRPTLMLFGLFLGYFVFDAVSWLIHMCFGIAAGFVLSNGWIVTNFLGLIVLVAIFVMMHVTLAFISFRLISILPQRVPAMIGFGDVDRVDLDQTSRDAAIVGLGGMLMNIQKSLGGEQGNQANNGQSGRPGAIAKIAGGEKDGIDTTLKKNT